MAESVGDLVVNLDLNSPQFIEKLMHTGRKLTEMGQAADSASQQVTKGFSEQEAAALRAAEKESLALKSLLGAIDPTTRAYSALDEQYAKLVQHFEFGRLNASQFEHFNSILNETRQRVSGVADELPTALSKHEIAARRAGISVGQYSAAMRILPMQMTDIATQLAGGQNPFLILLQQGGQVKDSFGGFRGMFSMLSAAVSPLTLGVGALATVTAGLAYSFYEGNKTLSDFNKTLILSGNIAGLTGDEMLSIVHAGVQAGLSFSQTSQTLTTLINAGVAVGAQFDDMTLAVAHFSEASGLPLENVAAAFAKLTTDPTAGLIAMAQQFHNVTAAQIEYVAQLQHSGDSTGALTAANEIATKGFEKQTGDLEANMGALERTANRVGKAFSGMWDSILDVGRPDSTEDIVKRAQAEVERAEAAWKHGNESWIKPATALAHLDQARKSAQEGLETALKQSQLEQQKRKELEKQAGLERERLSYQQQAEAGFKKMLTPLQTLTAKQKEYNDALKRGAITQGAYRINMDVAQKEYDDQKKKPAATRAYHEDAGIELLDEINRQNAAMSQQIGSEDKLSSATQKRIGFEQTIADLKDKTQLTAEQKSLLAMSDQVIAAYSIQESLSAQVTTLQEFAKMQTALQDKEEKLRDTTSDRLTLLEKMKATGKMKPGEFDTTSAAIVDHSVTEMPRDVQRLMQGNNRRGGAGGGLNDQLEQLNGLDKSKASLNNWYAENLESLKKHRQERADLNAQWDEQELALRKKHADSETVIEQQKNLIVNTAIQSGLSSMVDITRTCFGEKSAIYKATFIADKAFAIAQSMLAIETGIALASANPFPYNLVAMASVAAATAGLVSNIQSIGMVGMAHDGIENVPQTGTWLLQKGERVTTAKTSAKLDTTLNDIRQQRADSQPAFHYAPQFHTTGVPDEQTIEMMRNMARKEGERAYGRVLNETASGSGKLGGALRSRYRGGRVIT